MPAATAAGKRALRIDPVGRDHLDRTVGAGARRDVGVREDPDREVARRTGHGERAVEVSVVLGGGAGEVERQPLAADGRPHDDRQIPGARLEHVGGCADAVREGCDAGAGAPLGVVEDLGERGAQGAVARTRVELEQAPLAGAAGGELGAQVGAPLGRRPHLRRELGDHALVEHARLDHDTLLAQRAAVRRHRPGDASADVRVVGARGGEGEQLAVREHGRDHGDVGQVGAAAVGVVEDVGARRAPG